MRAPLLRAARAHDREALIRVFTSTRPEFQSLPPDLATPLLAQQYDIRDVGWRQTFPQLLVEVIEIDDAVVGNLHTDVDHRRLHLVDIALLPAHRGHGLGDELLETVLARARENSVPVRLQAERDSMALAWYRRHGFVPTGDADAFRVVLERPAPMPPSV